MLGKEKEYANNAYKSTLEYMYAQLPMYQRQGTSAFKKDLTNILALCEYLGNPQDQFKSVHIAGTNGKGSTAHMLAATCQAEGLKVGLYTSPHYTDFRERIKLNGKWLKEASVVTFINEHKAFIDELQPSFFEITVAMAFHFFAKANVDIAVIETGLGGRLDSTNVVSPLVSVITNISYDHQAMLGNTLPEIAKEKAGIIKANTPVIIGEYQPEITDVFTKKAQELNCKIKFASEQYKVDILNIEPDKLTIKVLDKENENLFERLVLDLGGTYQLNNFKTLLATIRELRMLGLRIHRQSIVNGLKHLKALTNFQGRFQVLQQQPMTICDSGHNEAGLKLALKEVEKLNYKNKIFILGFVNDKDIDKITTLLPQEDCQYIFTQPSIARALPIEELKKTIESTGLFKASNYTNSIGEAIDKANELAKEQTLVYIGGSTFVVSDALLYLNK